MNREAIVFFIDSALTAVAALIVIFCVRAVFVSLRRKFVHVNGKKATIEDEPVGFWLVIASWLVLSVLFAYPVVRWYFP